MHEPRKTLYAPVFTPYAMEHGKDNIGLDKSSGMYNPEYTLAKLGYKLRTANVRSFDTIDQPPSANFIYVAQRHVVFVVVKRRVDVTSTLQRYIML